MQRVLVAGATGQLGRCVLVELKNRGYQPCAIARDKNKLPAGVVDEVRAADLTKPVTLKNICREVDCVISCAGSSMNVNNFGDKRSFYEVDYQGNLNLLNEASKSTVKKFIYVSLAHGDELKQVEYADAHEKFIEELRKSRIDYTVVRPTGFFGFLLEILKFASKGRGISIGDGSCRTNPIHEADVAKACVDALEKSETELIVGGPEVMTRKEITELAFEVLNRRPRVLTFSPGVFRLLISPLKLFNRRVYALMDFGVAVTQIDVVAPKYGSRRLRDYFEEAKRKL